MKLRVFLWAILTGIIGWILYMGIVPFGKISYIYDLKKPSYFIKKITPEDRVEIASQRSQKITGDPVYFSLWTPRRFNTATITLKYKNKSTWPIVETGVLVDKKLWRYDLRPIENVIIDKLMLEWSAVREGDVVLLQKSNTYKTIEDFLNSNINAEEIALYNYELKNNFVLSDYKPDKKDKVINSGLRGHWQILTYIKDEDLDFKFNLINLNKNKDQDDLDFNIYYDGELIDSYHVDDAGGSGDHGEMHNIGEKEIKLSNLPEGVYKIELKANDDVVTEKIITKQSKFVFENKIWLFGGSDKISLFTDSSSIGAQTSNPGSLQKIKVNKNILGVDKTYKQFSLKLDGQLDNVSLEKSDVILSGDGMFSFDKNNFFNPNFKKINKDFEINSDIKYILAKYSQSNEIDGWRQAQATFDISNAYREFYKYSFLVSVPGLRADDEIDDYMEIDEIRVDLEGTSLFQKIKKYLGL